MNRTEAVTVTLVGRLSLPELHLLAMVLRLPVVAEADDMRQWIYEEFRRRLSPEDLVLFSALWREVPS
jgi:hypothetical protein